MTGQMSLEDALAARDAAIDQVEAHADAEWKRHALEAVARLARERRRFTTDDVWAVMGKVGTHEPRAMGAVMRQAFRLGLVRGTEDYVKSKRVACHGRPLRVWESTL